MSAAKTPGNPSPYAMGIGTRPSAVLGRPSSMGMPVSAGKTQSQERSRKNIQPPASYIRTIPRSAAVVAVAVRIRSELMGSSPRMA